MEGEEEEEAPGSFSISFFSVQHAHQERRAPLFASHLRTHSLSPFASPPSLSLKTKLPLSARIKLESP